MLKSMTGFAARTGEGLGQSWAWEIRGVNAKGLDIRLRAPDWIEGLETALKPMAQKAIGRGTIQIGLRTQRAEGAEVLSLNTGHLDAVLDTLGQIEGAAAQKGVTLAQTSAAEILAMRGVWEMAPIEDDPAALRALLVEDFKALLDAFNQMRAREGAALTDILLRQLEEVETLVLAAADAALARRDAVAATLNTNLARVMEGAAEADPDRVAQELALLAVKSDVSEEIDRLTAHVAAARELIASGVPVGRKLDFLMQEFNREANTLCSKSGATDLTRIGLDLKAVIDQMREQVQNVE